MKTWIKGGLTGFFIGILLMLIDFIRDLIFNAQMYTSSVFIKAINPLSWIVYFLNYFKIIAIFTIFGALIFFTFSKLEEKDYDILSPIGLIFSIIPFLILWVIFVTLSGHFSLFLFYTWPISILISLILNIIFLKKYNKEKKGKWMLVLAIILTIIWVIMFLLLLLLSALGMGAG